MSDDEKVYFENSDLRITSKRILIKSSSETLLISEVSDPKLKKDEFRDGSILSVLLDALDAFKILVAYGLKLKEPEVRPRPRGWRFQNEVVIKHRGKDKILVAYVYATPGKWSPTYTAGTPECEERIQELHRIAEAVGAAIAGV